MFDYQDLYHVGVRVRDLDAAMDERGKGLGLTWASVAHVEQRVWLPDRGATTITLDFTYSSEGPQHVELLKGEPGSIWDAADWPGVHHMGVWVDDVANTIEELVGQGWTLELAQVPPDEGYGVFGYVRSPSGFLLEPVAEVLKPAFERWWAGGSLW
jgi:catechol 2,3-dioxygenase-like lactoylglutathione lyase family enzyme